MKFCQSTQIRNHWGIGMERSGLRFEHLVWKWSKISKQKKNVFLADFALQNNVETTLPDGLETSG